MHPSTYLGVVYTLDHEVIPRPRKICIWLSNLSRNHFGDTEPKCHSDHGVQGPQKTIFEACSIHRHDPTCFAMGEAKEMLW